MALVESGVIDHWPRYLVIEATQKDQPLSKITAFAMEKVLKGLIGTVRNAQTIRYGNLIVEVERKAQAENLLGQYEIMGIPVKVSPHKSLNTSKGIVRSPGLTGISNEDLVQELHNQGVIEAKRFLVKREGNLIPTNTILLTFAGSNLPSDIKAGYLKIGVTPYIPNPLRCFNCQKFGHHVASCKHEKICAKCGLKDHPDTTCEGPNKCANCQGDHPAFFTTCPTWLVEKEICKTKTLQRVSYPEARRIVNTQPTSINLYSKAVASGSKEMKSCSTQTIMISVGTQTDVVKCQCKPNYNHKPDKDNSKQETTLDKKAKQNTKTGNPQAGGSGEQKVPPTGRTASLSPSGPKRGPSINRSRKPNLEAPTKAEQSQSYGKNQDRAEKMEVDKIVPPKIKEKSGPAGSGPGPDPTGPKR